jgi:hypothetical protein
MARASDEFTSGTGDVTPGDPETSYESKMIALRAERHDELKVTGVVNHFHPNGTVPDKFIVAQRTDTYYGPKLILDAGTVNYLLTAPGPDSQLLLWESQTGVDGFRTGWAKLAEVEVAFSDDLPQYDLCPHCGEPLKTLEHERMAGFGECPVDSDSSQ